MTERSEVAATPTTFSLVELVILVQRRLTRGVSAALAEDGATLEQWRVMRALADDQGRLMGELAEGLLIAHPTLTRVVDGLVDTGLVYRRQSSPDRRRVAVHLSRRGHERLSRLNALVEAYETRLSVERRAELLCLLKNLD